MPCPDKKKAEAHHHSSAHDFFSSQSGGTIRAHQRYRRMALPSTAHWLVLVALFAGGCAAAAGNPPRLYLAPDGDEIHVRLQPIEPNPY